jgi:hypothetical protein
MQIDLPLGTNQQLKRRAFSKLPLGHAWVSTEMKN